MFVYSLTLRGGRLRAVHTAIFYVCLQLITVNVTGGRGGGEVLVRKQPYPLRLLPSGGAHCNIFIKHITSVLR